MLKKEEKKHLLLKLTILAIVAFFISMAFIEPKPNVQLIEKQITKPLK